MSNPDPAGSNSVNPFQPPAVPSPLQWPTESGPVSLNRSIALLSSTRPWVLEIASLLYLFAVFFGVMGAVNFSLQNISDVLIALVMAALYATGGFHLGRYAKQIRALTISGDIGDLEKALAAQRSFWRFAGIAAIAVILIGLIGILLFASVILAQ